MAQVSLIQRTHAIRPWLYPQNNGPQFPGQFSGGSLFHHRLGGLPEAKPGSPSHLHSHGRGYNSIHSRAKGTLSFHGAPTLIMKLYKLENPILGSRHPHAINYEALIIYLQHIGAVCSTLSRKSCIVTQATVAESLFTLQASCRISLPGWLSVCSLKSTQEWNITLFQDKATWHNAPHPYKVTLVVFCKHCTNKHPYKIAPTRI